MNTPIMQAPVRRSMQFEVLEPRVFFAGFSAVIDNPYFPLIPGTTYVYSGVDEDGAVTRITASMLHETKTIAGVRCTVTHVQEFADGRLIENTFDWHAQDRAGNVWYFGEDSDEIEDDVIVSRAGSWQAGIKDAQPGIVMLANPFIGQSYFQENAPGIAEDAARIVSLDAHVPARTFGPLLQTEETTKLQPDVREYKYYARGIGLVYSQGVSGELDEIVLQSVRFETKAVVKAASPSLPGQRETASRDSILDESEILASFTVV